MGWLKQLCLSWIILSAAAVCVSCQELTSTLREGNRTCQGEEVVFTCTVRGPSSLSAVTLAWSSTEYISRSLQLSTTDGLGAVLTSSMDGNITATATVTNIANITGELILESTLRITAVVASMVTCMSGAAGGGTASIEFFISAVPGVPQRISAAEISRPRDNICIILVLWNPPANSDASDIDQYIVYVPSQNIRDNVVSSTVSTLTLSNCGDDVRVQVAAVNRVGCVGMNSSEVLPAPLDSIPTAPATSEDGSNATTEGGSASTSSQLDAGAVAGIVIVVLVLLACICILSGVIVYCYLKNKSTKQADGERKELVESSRTQTDDGNGVKLTELRAIEEVQHNIMAVVRSGLKKHEETQESHLSIKDFLLSLYSALRAAGSTVTGTQKDGITSAVGTLRAELNKAKAIDVRDGLKNSLEELKEEKDEDVRRTLDRLLEIFPDMSSIDDDFRSNIKELRDEKESPILNDALDNMIDKVNVSTPDEIQKILLSLCDALVQKFLKLSPKQSEAVNMFEISSEEVESLLTAEFTKGLESEVEDVKVKMFVTHVHEMPKGTEEGEFLVVDLGVYHLRVLHIIIIKGSIKKKDCKEFYISEDTKSSSYKKLFDFIVDRIAKFKKDRNIVKELPIGFTFPFPMKHESLTRGRLIRWTKDFGDTGPGAEGEDVVQLLKEAASKRGDNNMEVNVVALINDTVGILLSVGNEVPDCHIGLALGDGVNACYMEEVRAIPKFSGDRSHSKVIVNTEWGAFGDDGKLNYWRNYYDIKLDENSSNPGQQIFEKMISDKYQGRIVYLILKDLISEEALFGGKSSPKFENFKEFSRQRLSIMEGWDMKKCKKLFKDRLDIEASDNDCEVIRRVCVAVSTRAARLTAAGIVALVKKIKKTDGCTVAVDGFLYKRDLFPDRLRDALDELAPRSNIKMKLTEDGSSIGAAFAAAMNYAGSPPSSTPRSSSPEAEGSEGLRGQLLMLLHSHTIMRVPHHAQEDITGSGTEEPTATAAAEMLNIEDQGHRPPQAQAQAGGIKLINLP